MDRWIAWFGTVLGIAGLVSGYYFYRLSIHEPQPVFVVDPVQTTIFDPASAAPAPLRITREDGTAIVEPIRSLRFYFWNAGKRAIEKADILAPIEVSFGECEILDLRILKVSRPEITRASVVRSSIDPLGTLSIDLGILEQDDGISAQVICIGREQPSPRISGAIKGASSISDSTEVASGRFWIEYLRSAGALVATALCLGLFVLSVNLIDRGFKRLNQWATPGDTVGRRTTAKLLAFASKVGIVVLIIFGWTLILILAYALLVGPWKAAQTAATHNVVAEVPGSIRP